MTSGTFNQLTSKWKKKEKTFDKCIPLTKRGVEKGRGEQEEGKRKEKSEEEREVKDNFLW